MVVVLVVVLVTLAGLVDLVVVVDIQVTQEELEIQTLLQHIKEILVESETQDLMVQVAAVVVPVALVRLVRVQVVPEQVLVV
tara:strand:- start:345 stop:590 length:246 start_codon:yes stop_codon:yes gene_type:complete